jgi:hypothetical protein
MTLTWPARVTELAKTLGGEDGRDDRRDRESREPESHRVQPSSRAASGAQSDFQDEGA